MPTSSQQLDQRFAALGPFAKVAARPSRGWIKAIREALGMTTAQLALRMGVRQPRIVELEKSEVHGNITVQSLERAAEAMGCRLIYLLIPEAPLTDTLHKRASVLAAQQLAAVEQSMRLEDQSVTDKARQYEARQQLAAQLLRRPARLWDEL